MAMIPGEREYIDGLLWRERMGFMNWSDRAQLKNYRQVYPELIAQLTNERALDKMCDADAFPNK